MNGRRFYYRSPRKNQIRENAITDSLAFILVVILTVLLTLTKPNNIISKNIKPNPGNSKPIINKVQPSSNISNKTKPGAKIAQKIIPAKPIVIKKITRSETFKRGMDIINFVWEYDAGNNGIKYDKNITLPNYLKDVKKVKVIGLPYCWGGSTALDMSNRTDVKNFQDALKKGYTAGNVNCVGNYKYHTMGLDCSGFVCAVFKLPERCGTKDLYKYFSEININKLKPMDILNCVNNHVFIYLGETSDKKGVITMEAIAKKYTSNSEKTKINCWSWDSIKKGLDGKPFIAMRYKGIVDGVVNSFKDRTEYNFDKEYGAIIKLNQQYKGYIDYADDTDYFKINLDRISEYTLKLSSMPNLYKLTIINSKGKVFLNVKKPGVYNLKLLKDLYYVKVSSDTFKFLSNKYYLFKLQYSLKNKGSNTKSSNLQNNKVTKIANKKNTSKNTSKKTVKKTIVSKGTVKKVK